MKVAYRKRFLKDLASVPANFRGPIERFVFEELPRADSRRAREKSRSSRGIRPSSKLASEIIASA
jgi:hypothetical protein